MLIASVAGAIAYNPHWSPATPATMEGMFMKVLSLTLITCLTAAGYAYAQTPPPPPSSAPAESAPATSTPPASSSTSKSGKISHACHVEARKLCGVEARGSELQGCIKSNLDLNKFSDTCATQFKNAAAAKAAKPSS
jgi:hypothetical protein